MEVPQDKLPESVQIELLSDKDGYAPVFNDIVAMEYADSWFWVAYEDFSDGGRSQVIERFPLSSIRCVREFHPQVPVPEVEGDGQTGGGD